MAIAQLKLVEIEFPKNKSEYILSQLKDSDEFHPEPANQFVDNVRGLTTLESQPQYGELIQKIDELQQTYSLKLKNKVADIQFEQDNSLITSLLEQEKEIEDIKTNLQRLIKDNEETIHHLGYMGDFNIDFDELFTCKYLQVRFGRLPLENLSKIDYYDSQVFLFQKFVKDGKYIYCMYVTTHQKAPEVDNIFSSLYFERIHIPDYAHGTPRDAIKQLEEENKTAKASLEKYTKRQSDLLQSNSEHISEIYSYCKKQLELDELKKYVVVFGENAAIYGFAEEKYALSLKEILKDEDISIKIQSPTSDSRLYPPTKLNNNWFARPFKMFVEMYGIPSYTDFDPTAFVALSYTFLFGMMFGDVGQGILLSIVGYIAYKWKHMELGAVGVRIGISSALFGILFGSVFGNEEILTPFFMPMDSSNTMTLLEAAIAIGVVLIILSMLINTYLNIKKKRWGEVLFSQNGVAGLVFYTAVLFIVVDMIIGLGIEVNGLYIGVLIILPLLLMFMKEPLTYLMHGQKMFPEGFGGFFTESFFEMFEVLLTFIANTMSFLRVGGFVLSHAGMMLVVYKLAAMIGGIGYWIALILGNIFVMILEGMIVGIQVLRLEFYEMFSRYYEGNGRAFVSMKKLNEKRS